MMLSTKDQSNSLVKRHVSSHTAALLILFVLLLSIGYANLYSASAEHNYFSYQLKMLPICLLCVIIPAWFVPIRFVNTYAYLAFFLICLALILVLAIGHKAGGAQRWIRIGPVGFQPSEFAKLVVAMTVAKFFHSQRSITYYQIRDVLPIVGASFAIFILIFVQPDFGTAGICLLIAFAQMAFIRIQLSPKTLVSLSTLTVILGASGWLFFLRPYQKLRILNLLNPNLDPSGSGYNSIQSLVAIGSGSQFGKGYLQGTQTQLQFLPARHTDFIFSVFAEEHGFWGGTLVFLLFSWLTYTALQVARESRDIFNALLAIGIACLIFIEFTINIAMVLGLFPVVGMPLPFFSFGGSSLITVCIGVGLLIAIDRDNLKFQGRNYLS